MLSLANDFEGYMFIMFRGSKPFSTLFISNDYKIKHGLPRWLSGKESPANAGDSGLIPGWGRSPGERNDNPLQYSFLPGKSLGNRNLKGYSPWGHKRVKHNLATKQKQQNYV